MPDVLKMQICETSFLGFDREIKVDDEWVIRMLKLYGNCNINRFYHHNLDYIESKVGKLEKKLSGNCYILEVVK